MATLLKPFIALLAHMQKRGSVSRQEGQTLAEYALILALVALFVVGAIFFLRQQITDLFSSIGSAL